MVDKRKRETEKKTEEQMPRVLRLGQRKKKKGITIIRKGTLGAWLGYHYINLALSLISSFN